MMAFDIGLRASLVMLAALAASAALRGRSAALRHWVLAAGIFSAAAVAPLGTALPAWDFPIQPARTIDTPASPIQSAAAPSVQNSGTDTGVASPDPPSARRSVEPFVGVTWAAGVAISVMLLLSSFIRLVRVTRDATSITHPRWLEANHDLSARLNVRGDVALLKTNLPGMVGTWGWRRPCVLLPNHCESWSDARIRIVLGHELAHIRRADWSIQIAAEMVRAAFWYSPVFWIACARLRRESEQACDDAVLEAGVPADEYASHLLEIARTCRPAPRCAAVVPIARPSTLEWRITAMLNTTLARRRPTRRAMAIALAVILGVTVPAASFRATGQSGPMPLTGVVYDMTGAVLPEVTITLEDAPGIRRTATSDGSGRFDFGVVDPGRYVLTSALIGFLSITQELTLREARNWERAITLQVGTIQERVTVREQRTSGDAAATIAPVGAVRIGGNIRAPRKLEDVRPEYPAAMRDGGFEGIVPLEARIGVDGRVVSVHVSSAYAHPELVKAALDAVRQWRFSPTLLNGAEIEVLMNVTVQFSLPD
jgi:TonB family protein